MCLGREIKLICRVFKILARRVGGGGHSERRQEEVSHVSFDVQGMNFGAFF